MNAYFSRNRKMNHRWFVFLAALIALTAAVPAVADVPEQAAAEQAQSQAQTPSATSEAAPGQAIEPSSQPAQSPEPGAAESPDKRADGNHPPEYAPLVQKTASALLAADFTFYPIKALDPFVPFISPETAIGHLRYPGEDDDPLAINDRPLTPLQKMTVSEIERGLKAITWGGLGRKAVIEDSAGKGFIVAVGTPAGERSGVITQIFNDRLVIQQQIWDRKIKKRIPQDFIVKLNKKMEK